MPNLEEANRWERMDRNLNTIRRILSYFFFFAVVFLMWLLKKLLIPFIVALFLALLLLPLLKLQIKKGIPRILAVILSGFSLFVVAFAVIYLISASASSMVSDYPVMEKALDAQMDKMVAFVSNTFGMELESANLIETMVGGDVLSVLFKSTTGFALKMTNFTADFVIMMIYLFAILSGLTNYEKYLDYLENGSKKDEAETESDHMLLKLFHQIHGNLVTFMRIKFLASLTTGVLYGTTAFLFGVKYAFLIGFIAFALNFIPTVGSIVATIPPLILAMFTIHSPVVFLVFAILLISFQFLVGNILEPRFQGESLGINFITIIIGLVFFGFLWGVVGMLLSVPLLVLARTIFSHLPGANWAVRLMGTYKELKESK